MPFTSSYFPEKSNYLYSGKNIKKNFLQLRCSNVLLLLKYEVLFCELKIQFNNLAGGKALATDHRDHPPAHWNSNNFKKFSFDWASLVGKVCIWANAPSVVRDFAFHVRHAIFYTDRMTKQTRFLFSMFLCVTTYHALNHVSSKNHSNLLHMTTDRRGNKY